MAYQDLARRFKFLIAGYRRHGLAHVRQVFAQNRIRKRYAASAHHHPDTDGFMNRFTWFTSRENFLHDLRKHTANRLPLNRNSAGREFFTNLLLACESYDTIVTAAESVSQGRFTALGISICQPGGTFDWHRDYASGYRWDPALAYHKISFTASDGRDVKYPWELSRMYWTGWLGKAYMVTGNGAWSGCFRTLLSDWMRHNPVGTGVNWAMPMEVGIRGFWLMMGYAMFQNAPNIPADFWLEYLPMAFAHGDYLINNLEYFSNLTNHYIANCLGLVALGTLFPGSPDGRNWLHQGRTRLLVQLGQQVLPDGVHYERSVGYHRLVLEMYLIAAALCDNCGQRFPQEALDKLNLMADFLGDCLMPDGSWPQMGDVDDGLILRPGPDNRPDDFRDTISLAAAVLNRPDLYSKAGGYSAAALLITGTARFETLRMAGSPPETASRLYPDGGFAFLKNNAMHITAKTGPIGLHGNNDVLSFTLWSASTALIIDPGTYCYTRSPETRNQLRSSSAHNAPVIDGAEIAEFMGLWRVRRDISRPKVLLWQTHPDGADLKAMHQAYTPNGITVYRHWALNGNQCRITDRLEGSGTHAYAIRFTVPGHLALEQTAPGSIAIVQEDGRRCLLQADLQFTVRPGWYAPGYGLAAKAWYIEAAQQVSAPAEFSYLCRLNSKDHSGIS